MQKAFTVFIALASCLSWPTQFAFAEGYIGFTELKPRDCVVIDPQRAIKLPASWHKYLTFTKICPLKKEQSSKAVVSIISVWAEDYLNTKQAKVWEDFSYTIIVDDRMNVVGTLPEIFPTDAPAEPAVYFGKWKSEVPTEIRVDVYDPTVAGEHYYEPLIWNEKQKRYYMTDKEPKSGPRPKR
ncbi:hypothetical protein [Geomonas edaphica]|uniref:hypothetical protein n=1 Tax=Geomonas edaphica TaxID=2570226 RepID=UPI0010A893B8|nr:hypothetical protein [Geomonas edaphica]